MARARLTLPVQSNSHALTATEFAAHAQVDIEPNEDPQNFAEYVESLMFSPFSFDDLRPRGALAAAFS